MPIIKAKSITPNIEIPKDKNPWSAKSPKSQFQQIKNLNFEILKNASESWGGRKQVM